MTIDFSMIIVILNFVLLMIVLNNLLYKPLKQYFVDRQNKIQQDVNEASESIEKANQLVVKREDELKNSMEDARKMKDSIRYEAEKQAEQILHNAKLQERDTIQQTQNQLKELNKKAFRDIESKLSVIVANLTEKVLEEKIDSEKDKELINKLLAKRG
ncbi:MAG: hypothetical protein PHY08_01000 [Candidatus Cloacimonetes bacterium]|jgi:F-type H+-transporting ATPase subunit b|nr:hypothetical protein [Candidatus Cloacimonadota bacterium]MDD4155129.1 hypothetical protein [Candidatus Cloacimonadota bacterium]